MKITKSYLKQVIKEEIERLGEITDLKSVNDNIGNKVTIVRKQFKNGPRGQDIKGTLKAYDEVTKEIVVLVGRKEIYLPTDLIIGVYPQAPDAGYKAIRHSRRGDSEEATVNYHRDGVPDYARDRD